MQAITKRVVCIGGGHCNCQVLKLLKAQVDQKPHLKIDLTLVTESPVSYYSGMLPGTIATLYTNEDLQIEMEPLAKWCRANYVEQRVTKIEGNKNMIYLQNGETLEYDVLAVNVGSKTRDTKNVKGVWEHALTTRPINDLIPKIMRREEELKAAGKVPEVVICGAGAAGTELSFAFKKRWSALFGQDVKVTLISAHGEAIHDQNTQTKDWIKRNLEEKKIDLVTDSYVAEVQADGVILRNGTKVPCDVAVWATGAEAQGVTAESDLDIMKGFFRVNNFMQSTSHSNVFAGGDCVTMESYADKPAPTKAGVYAVRAGPIIAENIINHIEGEPLKEYVPQSGFLSLLMTGDGNCIGSKHGMGFFGKWVWQLKDHIDVGFMNLFNPRLLFKDYETKGTAEPIECPSSKEDPEATERRQKVQDMQPEDAAKILNSQQDDSEYLLKWQILQRMHLGGPWMQEVVDAYRVQTGYTTKE